MNFTDIERRYLAATPLGRLASIGPRGAPHVHPVAFWVDASAGTVDIGGPALRHSQKFRNVAADPRVSLVVDDQATPEESVALGGQSGRGMEIRGIAEIFVADQPLLAGFDREVIRIRPEKIITWNIDGHGYTRRVRAEESEPAFAVGTRYAWPPSAGT